MTETGKNQPFWRHKSLAQMSHKEWESLCDGCGKCCLHKLQDEETDALLFTTISCQYLDSESCRCQVYPDRERYVPECLTLGPDHLDELQWLPSTCSYRLLYEGKSLPDWHPLLTGDKRALHQRHNSVRGKVISETAVHQDDWVQFVIDDL